MISIILIFIYIMLIVVGHTIFRIALSQNNSMMLLLGGLMVGFGVSGVLTKIGENLKN